jgi:hypothetical protein
VGIGYDEPSRTKDTLNELNELNEINAKALIDDMKLVFIIVGIAFGECAPSPAFRVVCARAGDYFWLV